MSPLDRWNALCQSDEERLAQLEAYIDELERILTS